jgi:hypothetical protein
MKQHTGAPTTTAQVPSQAERVAQSGGTLLGWYTTARGRRHVSVVGTADDGLCVIDVANDGAVLVEPRLEEMPEARAIAADYLALASKRGEPQSRHPWPPSDGSPKRSGS